MKTSARFLAMLLAVVMIASAALSVSAFDDVAGNKHANAVNVLAQLGVIGGYEDGTFKPDQKVTRAEMAKLAYVLYTTFSDAGKGVTAFNDVAADNWAAGYINWCSKMGIIGGYGNGNFGPQDNVTYDQALKMVCGVLGYNEWDSNLWPTDVRMKALRDLALGEGLEDVKGDAQLTRAQVAQIMYNALDEDMNETKTEKVEIAPGYTVPVEVAKTLKADIWKFVDVTYTVTGTENYKTTGNKASDDDKIVLNGTEYELDKIGLANFEGKTDALIGLQVIALHESKVNPTTKAIEAGDMIEGSASVIGSVVDGVEVKYNKAATVLTVNGVEYKAEENAADELKMWTLNATVATNGDIFSKNNDKNESVLIADSIIAAIDAAYMARIIDVDGDGEVDGLVIVPKTAVKVTAVAKDGKTVTLKKLNNDSYATPAPAKITIKVAEDDVLVVANLGGIYYAEKVDAVETYATKLNTTAKKVTLAEVGEVKYADLSILGAATTTLQTSDLGADKKDSYYIYNGEIIWKTTASKAASEYNFAILKEIEVNEDDEINPETMSYETSYVATLIVDGKEVEVTLLNDDAEPAIIGATEYTAEAAYNKYKRTTTAGGKVSYDYTIVAAYEKEEGGYVLTINEALNDNDVVAASGADLIYTAKTDVFSIDAEGTANDINRIVLDANSVIYYEYTKPSTGDFKHLGKYTADTITTADFSADTIGETYLSYDETAKTYTLLVAMVADEIKGSTTDSITYENDGTLVLYAPVGSSAVINDADGKTYLEYTFKDKETAIDTTKTADGDDAATPTTAGKFYGWDEDEYVEIDKTDALDSFKYVTLDTIYSGNKGLVLDSSAGSNALTDDITIWGLGVDEDGKPALDVYVTMTAAELEAMLDLVNEYNADNDTELVVNAIFVSVEDVKGDFNLKTIIVEIFEENEDEVVEPINGTFFPA